MPSYENLFKGIILVFCAFSLHTGPALGQGCPAVVWGDEFSGTALDLNKWSYQTGDGCAEGLCGWGNNELQSYQQANVVVSGGTLRILAKKERVRGSQYTSGRIRTLGKGEWTYGRFEARIKLTRGQGIWPAFWMLPTDEVYGGWPQSGEIDIMENVGHELRTVHGTIHYGDPYPNNQSSGAGYHLNPAEPVFSDGFHTFAIEKEAGVIRWYVDDVLFSTKTTADTNPFTWPFNERFHFIMNVAVGGNWPGNPDQTTVFPQTLEADYVRVYDGGFPYLTGPKVVTHQAAGIVYEIGGVSNGTSVTWSAPAGAAVVSGQGTPTATIDWGTSGGTLTADVAWSCGSRQIQFDVEVEPSFSLDYSFENFDDPAQATVKSATGTLAEVANPNPSGINSSALSGRYTRSAAEQYDVLAYTTATVTDAGAYVRKDRKFYLDVYTSAPVGSQILLQLEDSGTATPSNYPAGRHSRYSAFTTVQNQWERLAFSFVDRPDPGTPDTAVEDVLLLFAPNTFTGDVYHFDNLDSYAQGNGSGETPTAVHVASVTTGSQAAGQGKKHGTATVTVHDDLGAPVDGATVTVTFTGDFSETLAGVTGADGSATVVTAGSKKGSLSFTACVDDVSHGALPYDPAANVQTCGGSAGKGGVASVPESFTLSQNYPNPFNPATRIVYALPEAAHATLHIYDTLGRLVAVPLDGPQPAGRHVVSFDASDLPSGIYLYRLSAGPFTAQRTMTLLR